MGNNNINDDDNHLKVPADNHLRVPIDTSRIISDASSICSSFTNRKENYDEFIMKMSPMRYIIVFSIHIILSVLICWYDILHLGFKYKRVLTLTILVIPSFINLFYWIYVQRHYIRSTLRKTKPMSGVFFLKFQKELYRILISIGQICVLVCFIIEMCNIFTSSKDEYIKDCRKKCRYLEDHSDYSNKKIKIMLRTSAIFASVYYFYLMFLNENTGEVINFCLKKSYETAKEESENNIRV